MISPDACFYLCSSLRVCCAWHIIKHTVTPHQRQQQQITTTIRQLGHQLQKRSNRRRLSDSNTVLSQTVASGRNRHRIKDWLVCWMSHLIGWASATETLLFVYKPRKSHFSVCPLEVSLICFMKQLLFIYCSELFWRCLFVLLVTPVDSPLCCWRL